MYRSGIHPAMFVAGANGGWRIERMTAVTGDTLPLAEKIEVHAQDVDRGCPIHC